MAWWVLMAVSRPSVRKRADIRQKKGPQPLPRLRLLVTEVVRNGPMRHMVIAGQGELQTFIPEEAMMNVVLGNKNEFLFPVSQISACASTTSVRLLPLPPGAWHSP